MNPPVAKDYIINDYDVTDSGNIGYPLDYTYTDYNELVTSPSIRTMNDPYQAANSKMDSNFRPDISSLMKLKDLRDLYQVPKSVPKKILQRKPKPKYHYYY